MAGVSAAMVADASGLSATLKLLRDARMTTLHTDAIATELEGYTLAIAGRIGEASLMLSSAAETIRGLGYLFHLALGAIARATLIRPIDAATIAAVDEAREILAGLRAAPLLELLENAVAAAGSSGAATVRSPTESVSSRPG